MRNRSQRMAWGYTHESEGGLGTQHQLCVLGESVITSKEPSTRLPWTESAQRGGKQTS